jgi:hypothetical protein
VALGGSGQSSGSGMKRWVSSERAHSSALGLQRIRHRRRRRFWPVSSQPRKLHSHSSVADDAAARRGHTWAHDMSTDGVQKLERPGYREMTRRVVRLGLASACGVQQMRRRSACGGCCSTGLSDCWNARCLGCRVLEKRSVFSKREQARKWTLASPHSTPCTGDKARCCCLHHTPYADNQHSAG